MALTKNDNPNALADPVHPNFAKIIVMLAVLTIGPLFAIPRTGAVSYDVGIRPFVPEDYYTAGLAIYSLFFFIVTYVLSINPSKLVDCLLRFDRSIFPSSYLCSIGLYRRYQRQHSGNFS